MHVISSKDTNTKKFNVLDQTIYYVEIRLPLHQRDLK